MKTGLHIRGRISNLYEHILMSLANLCSKHIYYVIVEGDSTTMDKDGDFPVTNAGITISNKTWDYISRYILDTRSDVNYSGNPQYSDHPYYCLTYAEPKFDGEFAFAINPDLSTYDESPILAPIIYDPAYHCFGFQPCSTNTIQMLWNWHMPIDSHAVFHVHKHYDWQNNCFYFVIDSQPSIFWKPIAWLIWREAFRYADHRYNIK